MVKVGLKKWSVDIYEDTFSGPDPPFNDVTFTEGSSVMKWDYGDLGKRLVV